MSNLERIQVVRCRFVGQQKIYMETTSANMDELYATSNTERIWTEKFRFLGQQVSMETTELMNSANVNEFYCNAALYGFLYVETSSECLYL